MMTPFAKIGGEIALRAIINDFVDRVYADVMIGFFFRSVKASRIKEMEYQLAAEMLGANIEYGGRRLDDAHRKHRIMGGQFARRKQILRETLEHHDVPAEIVAQWMKHTDSLRRLITSDQDHECE